MARPLFLLDLPVLAELTRPGANRQVLTRFGQNQHSSAIAASVVSVLLRGVETLPEGPRRTRLSGFVQELLRSGPQVLAFDREAAVWLARAAPRRQRQGRVWTSLEGEQAAIASVQEMTLVTRSPTLYAGASGLKTEDWFRP